MKHEGIFDDGVIWRAESSTEISFPNRNATEQQVLDWLEIIVPGDPELDDSY